VLTVSPDQQTLTIDTETTLPDGKVERSQDIEQRVGAGRGLAGTWRSANPGLDVADTIALTALADGRIRWAIPEDGNFFDVAPNGPPAINQGPRAVPTVKLAVQTVSPTEMRWTETIADKPFTYGIDILAADGSLIETTWTVQFPADKQKAVYRSQ
jgi:hypothetical protein